MVQGTVPFDLSGRVSTKTGSVSSLSVLVRTPTPSFFLCLLLLTPVSLLVPSRPVLSCPPGRGKLSIALSLLFRVKLVVTFRRHILTAGRGRRCRLPIYVNINHTPLSIAQARKLVTVG